MAPELTLTCLCGAVRLMAQGRPAPAGTDSENSGGLALCHCSTCRHVSGVLCTSYYPLARGPAPEVLGALEAYPSSARATRYFCRICGCHVLRAVRRVSPGPGETEAYRATVATGTDWEWEAATGTIVDETGLKLEELRYTKHQHVADTVDGGLSGWIPEVGAQALTEQAKEAKEDNLASAAPLTEACTLSDADGEGGDVLPASCHCCTIRFDITRPDASSYKPRSNLPDLMIAYNVSSPRTANPDDEKWWLRPGPGPGPGPGPSRPQQQLTRYLAGTCACVTCRLATGFEIQTWAFVPRSNIFFHLPPPSSPSSPAEAPPQVVPLSFSKMPETILRRFGSSPGVERNFCPRCGATVFWHDATRPELIDVSVGLLRGDRGGGAGAGVGARAEQWLDWWTGRVSFSEETAVGRRGRAAERATALIRGLERGLAGTGA